MSFDHSEIDGRSYILISHTGNIPDPFHRISLLANISRLVRPLCQCLIHRSKGCFRILLILTQKAEENGDKITTAKEPNWGYLRHQEWRKKGRNAKKEDIAGQKERWTLLREIIQGLSLNFMYLTIRKESRSAHSLTCIKRFPGVEVTSTRTECYLLEESIYE